jgi:ferritin-like metal-binding protein YciE
LQDIYYAENKIAQSLPDMISKASNPELKRGFQQHLRETQGQIKRLDRVFKAQGEKPKGTDCPAIDGILEEASEIAGEIGDERVLNAALIASAQAVEHYEITRYGTLIAWARELGFRQVIPLLRANLKEELATDKKLNKLAKGRVNASAAGKKKAAKKSAKKSTKTVGRKKKAKSRR